MPLGAAVARAGNVLTVDLSITLEDGTAMPADFDMGNNVRFRLGHGGLPPFVHAAVEGMVEKESKTVVVPPDEAYGTYYPELAAEIPAENAPRGLKVGDKVSKGGGNEDGREVERERKRRSHDIIVSEVLL